MLGIIIIITMNDSDYNVGNYFLLDFLLEVSDSESIVDFLLDFFFGRF